MKTKFNLSDERKSIVQFAELDKHRWKELMQIIEIQDKEFIQELKAKMLFIEDTHEIINKLAGKDLT